VGCGVCGIRRWQSPEKVAILFYYNLRKRKKLLGLPTARAESIGFARGVRDNKWCLPGSFL
jgi:hypothetical protein